MNDARAEVDSTAAVPDAGNILVIGSGEINLQHEYTELWMPDGQVIRVPTQVLTPPATEGVHADNENRALRPANEPNEATIPLIEERLLVSKRTIATGVIRLQKTVQTYQETLDEPLAVRTFDVERIVLNQPVDAAPTVRQEGDTTIYPLVEEQLVLTKRLILKEEVRVTRREAERRDTQTVTLRREHLTVERESLTRD